jgi:hypothetical protein
VREDSPGLASEFPNGGHNHRKKDDEAKNRHEKPSHVSPKFPFALCGFILGFHACPPSLKVGWVNRGATSDLPRPSARLLGANGDSS